jgi:transcriptional regulator GlxA family with amidase domain
MAYLKRWRLRLGARSLTGTSHSVAQIASDVGYESEAAFNRRVSALERTSRPARRKKSRRHRGP